jgi:hypothetical protein
VEKRFIDVTFTWLTPEGTTIKTKTTLGGETIEKILTMLRGQILKQNLDNGRSLIDLQII